MIKMQKTLILLLLTAIFSITSCVTSGGSSSADSRFLKNGIDNKNIRETFRVLISSDNYQVVQTKYTDHIKRVEDPGGDSYISDELKKFDKINESREGEIKIWLYPDSGRLMKVRPQKPIYLLEIDELLSEDIQRWSFKFPKKVVVPTQMFIRYRVVLRKKQSDDAIIQEIQKKMLD